MPTGSDPGPATATSRPATSGPRPGAHAPGLVVLGHTARRAVRSGVLWGYVLGIYTAVQALAYASTYKTAASRNELASLFGSNSGISALVGPAHAINTVAGYTVWKCLAVVAIVGAVWGMLTSTRLLRGEEDAGRWELLLAGRTTRRGATAQAFGGLAVGFVVLWALTAVITVAVGRMHTVRFGVAPSLFFALTMVTGAGMFLAVGALTSQLAATRRQAAGYAAAFLGACYVVRMVADSGTGLGALRWASPLGWIEELQPLTAPRPLALVPIAGFTVVVGALAVHLAGRRDLLASTVPDMAGRDERTGWLSGPLGLTGRLVRPTAVAWGIAVVAFSLLLGTIAKSAGKAIEASSSIMKVLHELGIHGSGAVIYLGVEMLIVALVVALIGAGQLTALRGEEAEGRLDHLLARPVSRTGWLCGRLGTAAAVVVLSGVVAGLCVWLGTATQHTGIAPATLLTAGLNAVAPALCILGIGTLAFGVRPRATSAVTYGYLSWAALVGLVGSIVNLNHWVLDTSVFAQMATAPSQPVDWTSFAVLIALGALGALGGWIVFRARDLAGE